MGWVGAVGEQGSISGTEVSTAYYINMKLPWKLVGFFLSGILLELIFTVESVLWKQCYYCIFFKDLVLYIV